MINLRIVAYVSGTRQPVLPGPLHRIARTRSSSLRQGAQVSEHVARAMLGEATQRTVPEHNGNAGATRDLQSDMPGQLSKDMSLWATALSNLEKSILVGL